MKNKYYLFGGLVLGCSLLVFRPAHHEVKPEFKPQTPTTSVIAPRTRYRAWSELYGPSMQSYALNLENQGCPLEVRRSFIFFELLRAKGIILPNALAGINKELADQFAICDKQLNTLGFTNQAQQNCYLTPEQDKQAALSIRQATDWSTQKAGLIGFSHIEVEYCKSELAGFGGPIDSALAGFKPTKSEYLTILDSMETNSLEDACLHIPNVLTSDRLQQVSRWQTPLQIGVYDLCQKPGLAGKEKQVQDLISNTNLTLPQFRQQALLLNGPFTLQDLIDLRTQVAPFQE